MMNLFCGRYCRSLQSVFELTHSLRTFVQGTHFAAQWAKFWSLLAAANCFASSTLDC